jgi:two-component system, NarL family, response regulator LiaR
MTDISTESISETDQKSVIKILIADDHPLIRQALRLKLQSQSDFKIIAEASNGEEAVKLALKLLPDVIILDISMPKINGLEVTRQIKAKSPSIKVLVLTVHSDNEHIVGLLEAGAAGYLTKDVFAEEVIPAIRAVMAGEGVLSSPILQQIIKNLPQNVNRPIYLNTEEKLSPREIEILKLAARGLSNKDIAHTLNLSLQTVKGHSVSIFSKLKVASRTEAVMVGLRAGIVTLKDLE